jgi:hypothetical protein
MSLESRSILKRSNLFDWAFAFLILFSLATNLVWFLTDNHILGDGSQNHLLFSVDFFHRFSSVANSTHPILEKIAAVVKEFGMPSAINSSSYWPQGFNLSTCFFYSVAGTTLFAAKVNLLPYLFILLLSTYCIGRHIDSSSVGLVAAVSLFFYPIIFQSSRQYQLDFPLTAVVALNVLFLLKSERFRNIKFSLLFGVASGWAMLIKSLYVIFIAMPLLYELYGMCRESWREILQRPFHSRQLRNLVLALTMFVPIAMIWWGPRLSQIPSALYEHIFNPVKNFESTPFPWSEKFSLECLFFQTHALFYTSLRPFFSTLFFIALPFFLIKKTKEKPFFLFWIIFPVFFFTFLVTLKHTRFLMPVLPAMALITAVGLCHIKSRIIRTFIFIFGIFFALFQFYILSYVSHGPKTASIGGFSFLGKQGFGSDYETFYPPHNQTFKINEKFDMVDDLVRIIEKNSPVQAPVIFLIQSGKFQNLTDLQWTFRMLLRHPSFKFTFMDAMNPDSGADLNSINFVVCFYSGSTQITPERFATTSLEVLLRSSEKWDGFERQWKLKAPGRLENFLKSLAKNNDRFVRVLRETDKDNENVLHVYQNKR